MSIFDQIHAEATAGAPPAAGDTDAPAGNVFDRIHATRGALALAPAPAKPAPKPAPETDLPGAEWAKAPISFFRSMYDEGIAPFVEMAKDAIDRGDLGEHSAQQILGAFKDQLWNFQQHPDIRNLPLVGPGATATAAKLQKQYDAGDYAGMGGTLAGFLGVLAAPEAAPAVARAAGDAAATAAEYGADAATAAKNAAKAGVKAATAGMKAAAPDVAKGAAKAAGSVIAEHLVPGGGLLTKFAEYGGITRGGTQAFRGIQKGISAAGDAYAAERAAQAAAEAATQRAARGPRVPIWQQAAEDAAAAKAAQAEAPAAAPAAAETVPGTQPLWDSARREAAAAAAAERAGETPAQGDVIDVRPDARETLSPEAQATADAQQAATHEVGTLYHGSPREGLTETRAGSMYSDDPGWGAGYATKINPDSTEDFTGRVYAAAPVFTNPVTVSTLHGAERKLLELADATGKPYSTLEGAANLVHAETGIDGIIARNKDGKVTGAIPLTPTAVADSIHPADALRSNLENGRPIASNMETALARHEAKTAGAAAEPESDLEAQMRASIEQAQARKTGAQPAAPAQQFPVTTAAQHLEDALHEHAAYLEAQGEDIKWANRARKADRLAQYLIENNLEATPENMETAARHLAEAKPPSAETADMIRDRVDWHNARQARLESESGQGTATGSATADATGETGDAGTDGVHAPVFESRRPGARTIRATGEPTTVETPGESHSYPARYEVRELSEVQPSHNPHNFNENPRYSYANDRNYDNPENQRKIIEWSADFKPRNLLNTAPDASSGPPVIDGEGNVLGGNGRSMILGRVYKNNPAGAAAYRAELDRTAGHYGIDPESYAHMKEPVLVRRLADGAPENAEAAQRAITDFNKTGTAALTPSERAIADARRVSVNTLEDISRRMDEIGPDATLAQTLEGKSGGEVLARLMDDGVISPQEGAQLRRGGQLTRAGQERISGLMLGRFFTNAGQLDDLAASVRNKMEKIAAPLARVEGNSAYSLSGQMKRALDLIEDAEAHNMELEHLTKQAGFFSQHNYPPDVVALAKNLVERNPNALTQAVRDYAERAKYAEEYRGPGMFGDIPEPVSPGAAFREAFSDEAIAAEKKAAAEAKAKRREKKAAQE